MEEKIITIVNPLTNGRKEITVTDAEVAEGCEFARQTIEQLVNTLNDVYKDYSEQTVKIAKLRDALKGIL